MAKVKNKPKVGRRSNVRPKAEVKLTREETIKHMCALGFSNEAMWGAMEREYPAIIEDNTERLRAAGKSIPYEPKLRKAIGEQLRSVKGLAIKQDEAFEGLVSTGASVKSIDGTEFKNRPRWSCGWPALDHIYGETKYVMTEDAPNSKYRMEDQPCFDEKTGKIESKPVKVWVSGDWQRGDPMCYKDGKLLHTRDKSGTLISSIFQYQKIESGLPSGYFGFWGGETGVGKSRTAIDLTHSVNRQGRLVHYYNGEADPGDFRSWCGAKVNKSLFRVFHAGDHESSDMVPLSVIEDAALREQPSLIIIDSVQLIQEYNKQQDGQKRCLARLKMLKVNEAAGRPHIILISQLNKQKELAGLQFLQHIVDYSIKVFKRKGHNNQFYGESIKMRGAECPRGQLFKHTDAGVVCLSTEYQKPVFNLVQNPVIAQGIQMPQSSDEQELIESEI